MPNPINRYSVSDRSGLVANTDGSVDIHIQNAARDRYASGVCRSRLARNRAARNEAAGLPEQFGTLIGRVFVESDSDLPTAYALAKQIQIIPSTVPQSGQ